jgi:hypothetical protein
MSWPPPRENQLYPGCAPSWLIGTLGNNCVPSARLYPKITKSVPVPTSDLTATTMPVVIASLGTFGLVGQPRIFQATTRTATMPATITGMRAIQIAKAGLCNFWSVTVLATKELL